MNIEKFVTFKIICQLLINTNLKLIGNASDRTIIDKDLENLELWEKRWLLKFNIDKCKVLHLNFFFYI